MTTIMAIITPTTVLLFKLMKIMIMTTPATISMTIATMIIVTIAVTGSLGMRLCVSVAASQSDRMHMAL